MKLKTAEFMKTVLVNRFACLPLVFQPRPYLIHVLLLPTALLHLHVKQTDAGLWLTIKVEFTRYFLSFLLTGVSYVVFLLTGQN